MMSLSFTVEYRVAATALSIRAISMSLRAFLNNISVVSDSASMLELAIAEGMNNVLEHAYDGQNEGEMRIVVHLDDMQLTIKIFDHGMEPNRERVSSIPPLPEISDEMPMTDELLCEGRGLFIMESLMDTLDYERIGDENCLKMTKSLKSA
ncbi:MAG: ATP-binding protein [Deltaproteobacteria bacterium]|nr:ATP-binding protein [Deltaproteobacteria bacterium]